jgi:DNA-directed RNA polymerase subunit beta'
MAQTLGQLLVNDVLPAEHRGSEPLTKSALVKKLTAIGKESPDKYVEVVSKLKRVGDEITTLEGVSVGLDDVAPHYKKRDEILMPAVEAFKKAQTQSAREKIILDTQDKMLSHTKEHPGSMAPMALSGARGNIPQLMKIVGSPVAAVDAKGVLTPWLIGKSYSEGLAPADYWVAGNEARINTVKSSTSVAEPGDLAKILVNNMYPLVVTTDDCGTKNGIPVATSEGHLIGRYLARDVDSFKRNTAITPDMATKLRDKHTTVIVRSPLTCEAHEGVCRKCQGLDERDRPHAIGVNVGVRAAQALSEPLTQFSLSAKHGVRLLKGASKMPEGLQGVRQLIEIPESFVHKATLSEVPGKVESVVAAPHGGNYVTVAGHEHYVSPLLEVLVKPGQAVEAGDVLSEGIPKPDEVVQHKGLGAGRQYLADALFNVYKAQAGELDKRHFELLAKAELNHVKIIDHSEKHPELLRGEIVSYPVYKNALEGDTKSLSIDKAEGHLLGKETLHFTVGTPLTGSVLNTLKINGYKTVDVAENAPRAEFVMKPMARNPLLHPDWMARMSHRYLKDYVLKGVHFGDVSDIHGTHPVPAYAYGAEFGSGPDGRY